MVPKTVSISPISATWSKVSRCGGRAPWRGGNESVGVIVDVGVAARQLASSSLVLGPTSFVSSASLSISWSFAIDPSER